MGEHDASIRICVSTMVEYLDGRLGKLMTEYIYLDESSIWRWVAINVAIFHAVFRNIE